MIFKSCKQQLFYMFSEMSRLQNFTCIFKKKMEGNHSFDFCWTRHGIILNCGLLFFRMRSINGRVTDKIWLLCLHRHFCNFSYCIEYDPQTTIISNILISFNFTRRKRTRIQKIAELLFLVQLKGVFLHPVAPLHGFIAVSARCLFSLHAGFTA